MTVEPYDDIEDQEVISTRRIQENIPPPPPQNESDDAGQFRNYLLHTYF